MHVKIAGQKRFSLINAFLFNGQIALGIRRFLFVKSANLIFVHWTP